MKRLRYIFAILMSSLIIISGAGVSIIHYCCSGCRMEQRCCTSGCSECEKAHYASQETCKDTGCTTVHYKVDVVKHVQEASSTVAVCTLYCEQLPQFGCLLPVELPVTGTHVYSPPRYCGSSIIRRCSTAYLRETSLRDGVCFLPGNGLFLTVKHVVPCRGTIRFIPWNKQFHRRITISPHCRIGIFIS